MSDAVEDNRAISPDSQCRICLGPHQTKCIADSNCYHQFCLNCLIRWSEVKPECPLCKRPFKKILYNIKSPDEYDTHEVQPPRESPDLLAIPSPVGEARIFPIHLSEGFIAWTSRQGPQGSGGVSLRLLIQEASGMWGILPNTRDNNDSGSHRRTLSFRQSIYDNRLWVHGMGRPTRECSPTYYRENRNRLARIRPWLKRELSVFISDRRRAAEITESVLELMTQRSIESREFRAALVPVIGERYDHFLHEFRSFASSYYDIRGFDENCRYDIANPASVNPRRRTPQVRVVPPPSQIIDDDSDVEVISTPAPEQQTVTLDSDSDVELIEPPIRPELPEIVISSDEDNELEIEEVSPPTASPRSSLSDPDWTEPAPSTSKSKPLSTRHGEHSKRTREISSSGSSSDSNHLTKRKKTSGSRKKANRLKKSGDGHKACNTDRPSSAKNCCCRKSKRHGNHAAADDGCLTPSSSDSERTYHRSASSGCSKRCKKRISKKSKHTKLKRLESSASSTEDA